VITRVISLQKCSVFGAQIGADFVWISPRSFAPENSNPCAIAQLRLRNPKFSLFLARARFMRWCLCSPWWHKQKIKADRSLTLDPLKWQTDNFNGLVMVIRNYHWLDSASRVLISTFSAPLVQTGEHKQFSLFDLELWPTTLTYKPRLAKIKIDPHAKNSVKGQTVQTGECPQTNGRTHGRYQTYYCPCYAVHRVRI